MNEKKRRTVRFTDEEWDKLTVLADAQNLSTASLVRYAVKERYLLHADSIKKQIFEDILKTRGEMDIEHIRMEDIRRAVSRCN